MTDINQTPSSQPADLTRRFEPARACVAPRRCNPLLANCWVRTAKAQGNGRPTCAACRDYVTLAGNEAKHAAVLRRCMAAQNEVAP